MCVRAWARLSPHLSLLVEGHHHHGSSVTLYSGSSEQELLLSLFQTDTVDYALALAAFQASLNHREVRGVNAQRHLQGRISPSSTEHVLSQVSHKGQK